MLPARDTTGAPQSLIYRASTAAIACNQARDIPADGEIEADTKPGIPDRRVCGSARRVEEEVPGHVSRPAHRHEHGPAPGADDGRTTIEHRADQLQAEVARWSAMVQGEGNVGDGGDAEAHAVHEHLATPRESPGQEHQPDRAENSDNDCDIRTSQKSYPTTRLSSRFGT